MNVPIKSVSEFHTALDKAMSSDKIKTIVIESFTSLIEIIFREADIRYKGFDVWSYYNKEIDKILDKSKNSDKYIVFTAIDGVYDGDNGVEERFVAVDGNRWKKRVEKEFVCVYLLIIITQKIKHHTDLEPNRMVQTLQKAQWVCLSSYM